MVEFILTTDLFDYHDPHDLPEEYAAKNTIRVSLLKLVDGSHLAYNAADFQERRKRV